MNKNNIFGYRNTLEKEVKQNASDIQTLETELKNTDTYNVQLLQTQIDANIQSIEALVIEDTELENQITVISNELLNKADITYVDSSITNLVNGAPDAYNTLLELHEQLQNNETAVDAIVNELSIKANISYVNNSLFFLPTSLESQISVNSSNITINANEIIALSAGKSSVSYVDTQIGLLGNQITVNSENIAVNDNLIETIVNEKASVIYVDESLSTLDLRISQNETDIGLFNNLSIGSVVSGPSLMPNVTLTNGIFDFVLKDGITPTFHIFRVETGSTSHVDIDQVLTTESDIYLNFTLQKGDKGDRGKSGSGVSDDNNGGSFFSGLVGGVSETIQYAAIIGTIAAIGVLQSQVAILQAQIITINAQILAIQSKVLYQSTVFGETIFQGNLKVNIGDFKLTNGIQNVVHFTQTDNYIKNPISFDSKLTCLSEIEGGKITANGDIYTPDNLTVIGQINTDNIRSNNNTITIGHTLQGDTIYLNGTVVQPLQQFYDSFGFNKTENGYMTQF